MTDGREPVLSIKEAAARLGVHPKTLRNWVDKGLVAHLKLPSGYRRFEEKEIERIAREMRHEIAEQT